MGEFFTHPLLDRLIQIRARYRGKAIDGRDIHKCGFPVFRDEMMHVGHAYEPR